MEGLKIEKKKEFLKAKIDLPNFKLDVTSGDATRSLWDIRRIVECLYSERIGEDISVDEYLKFELSSQLSEEFLNNEMAMKILKNKLETEESYKISRVVIKGVKEIDLVNNREGLKINNTTIVENIQKLFIDIPTEKITECLVHIKGYQDKEKNLFIIDKISEILPQSNIKAFHSNTNLDGRIIIEAIFFGEF